jgi:hypothetical protein
MTCEHGIEVGVQGGIQQQQIDACDGDELQEATLLRFYSACDCCDYLMHHDTPYFVLRDGRTLCSNCYRYEPLNRGTHG